MPKFDKTKVVTAASKPLSKLDLSHAHLTTSNFMDLQPIMYRHMIPNEKLLVNAHAFARLAPMAVPTYGRCRLNMRGFFVPFRTVMPTFTEFIEDTIYSGYRTNSSPATGIPLSTPVFTNTSLYRLFTQRSIIIGSGSFALMESSTSNPNVTSSNCDYVDSDNSVYWRFTAVGRKVFKVFRSLGYNLIFNSADNTAFSALALLAYLRVYYDWYSVSQYLDTASYQKFASWFTYHDPNTPLELDSDDLLSISRFLFRVCYDGDYFTACWDNPVAPNTNLFSQFVIPDVTNESSIHTSNVGQGLSAAGMSTPVAHLGGTTTSSAYVVDFTQFTVDALKGLTDYMKRHQLVGARAVDRYLADWGINLPADKLQRSTYLGMSSMDIRIGDVMSNADTSGSGEDSNLGDYAGQGHINGGKSFEFQASEFGLFIITASIMPTQGYYQGFDRNNLHVSKDQFFTPDFDNLGVQSIAKGELYISPKSGFAAAGDYDATFGYTPRYAEYKIGRDQVTGDISLNSVLTDGHSWHLMREFDDSYFNDSIVNVKHDLNFCLGDDADQYSRIFNNMDSSIDKFYLYYDFNVIAHSPCKSLFDTYEFDSDGKSVVLDANGVKMN